MKSLSQKFNMRRKLRGLNTCINRIVSANLQKKNNQNSILKDYSKLSYGQLYRMLGRNRKKGP